jgi:signal transduction histidine kinase
MNRDVARVAGRIAQWFGRRDTSRLSRELAIRMEERQRERARLAGEMHETLLQGFVEVSRQLQEAIEKMPVDTPNKPSLCRAMRLMQRVIAEGRDALDQLRTSAIASMSLEQALSGLRNEFAPSNVRFRIFVKGDPRPLQPAVQEQVYLIGRDALVNAVRHSEATNIEAEVEYLPRKVRVVVRDNGCGLDPQSVRSARAAQWGLTGMRERADSIGGQLRVWSRPGAGTEVEISVPGSLAAEACA